MKIKKIDVVGFKSFMEKATLTFPERITAVVGPNGCGKSNLVDAIRWVIGEQSSKHLRGKGMEDMIFSGSEKYSPLGMAEVKITFTNDSVNVPANYAEYSEITVARRLYKSGESEYRINNARCRLMDIKDLFMDTGISAKAYAIVEQGKVDTVVNSKPEDKRILIDEAAGITKYKSRKDAALKKISATQQNLQRTKDVIHEIKKQLSSVERQAKRAEAFKKLRGEFKEIELKLIHIDNEHVKHGLESLRERLKLEDENVYVVEQKLRSKDNDLETLKISNLDVEKQLSETQESYLNKLNDVRKKETEIEFKERRKDELIVQKNDNLSEIEDLKRRVKGLKDEVEGAKKKVRAAEGEHSKEEKKVFDLTKEYDQINTSYKEKSNIIDKEKSALVNILTNIARTKNDTANFEHHLTTFSKSAEKLKKEEDFLNERIIKSAKELKDLETTYAQAERERGDLKNDCLQNELKLDELNENHEEQNGSMQALEDELKDVSAHLNSLTELKNSYEGFDTGVKALMSARAGMKCGNDILGVVTDFIDVEPEYETAVSSYLGDRLQYVVAKSKKSIVESVKYLKKNNKGKAGFILLENGKDAEPKAADSSRLINKITVDKSVRPAFSRLFSNAHYADKFESAIVHLENSDNKTYITKDGDIINNTIYAGSKSVKGEKLLSRERQIKELNKKAGSLNKRFVVEEKALSQLKSQIEAAENSLENIKDSQHEVEIKSLEIMNRINRAKEEGDRLKGRDDIIKFELEEIKAQADDVHNKLLLSKVKLEEYSSDKDKKERELEQYSKECDDLNKLLDEKGEELTVTRVNVARLKAEKENILRSIELLNETLDSDIKRISKLKNSIEIIEQEELDIKVKVKEIELSLKETIKLADRDKQDVDKLKAKFDKNIELLRGGELEATRIKNELIDITNAKNALALKTDEAQLYLSNIKEKLREKYDMTPEALEAMELPAGFKKDSAVKRLEVLRQKINNMGEVNLLAIDEYEELNKRYTFIMEQQEDLLRSISTLNKAIKRINRTSKKRFKETFDLVSEKFTAIFPKLFNGGHAELKLVDEDNILETGVEIIAQPPGKKLQNINLLSGGEKALTAVSLIFAIFMIKPSPFCLLDEVDAPLDDANIGRFSDMIKEMSDTSQFILITHSKKTMEIADTLYGVTMESPGISKIVSVAIN